jgi:hypothetical protein
VTRLRQGDGAAAFGGLLIALWLYSAAPAVAQEAPHLRVHRVTLGGSLVWSGGYDIGDASAQLRGNAPGPTAPAFNWFSSSSRMTRVFAPGLHVGFAVTPTIAIDGGVAYAKPHIAYSIARDAETTALDLPGEQIEEYVVGAALTWQLPLGRKATVALGKLAPFVTGGAAYLRQLHEDRALAENGQVYYAGGGARYWLKGGSGASRDLGVRADARFNVRRRGIDFENRTRTYPSVTVTLFVGL